MLAPNDVASYVGGRKISELLADQPFRDRLHDSRWLDGHSVLPAKGAPRA